MNHYTVLCQDCRFQFTRDLAVGQCPHCDGAIEFQYDLEHAQLNTQLPGIWRFIDLLPVRKTAQLITLHEGDTPMIPARLSDRLGRTVRWKWEWANPTGSQKDRGLAVAMTKGRELGFRSAIIGSTGSAGLSSAAYAARAGMRQVVLVSSGTPLERVAPVATLGATIVEVEGTIEDTLDLVLRARRQLGVYETTTYRRANPYQSEGAKTLGYDISLQSEDWGGVPDWIVIPVGGGGTLGSVWRAFKDLREMGRIDRLPKLAGVQPVNFAGLQIAMQQGLATEADLQAIPFDNPEPTILVKLAHTFSHDGTEALAAIRESGGELVVATDDEAIGAQRQIGAEEGLYAEPSSAVVLTAIEQLISSERIHPGENVVGVLTGSGHRETHVFAQRNDYQVEHIRPETGLDWLTVFLDEG